MLIICKFQKSISGRTKCSRGPYVARRLCVWDPWNVVWNLLNYARIEDAHKRRKKLSFFIMWMLYVQLTGGTEQMRACVSRYDQSAWTAN